MLFTILLAFACNRKPTVVQETSEVQETTEEVNDSTKIKGKYAETVIERFGNTVELTDMQKKAIRYMANEHDFSAESQEEQRQKWKAFRKKVNEIVLTPEQRQLIKSNKRQKSKNGDG